MRAPFAVGLLLAMLIATDAKAVVVASFQFDGNSYVPFTPGSASNRNISSSAALIGGVTVSEIQFSPGLNPDAALGQFAPSYNDALGFGVNYNADTNSDGEILSTDQAIFFTVDLAPGVTMDLDSISFDTLKTRVDDNATVTEAVFVNPNEDPASTGLSGLIPFEFGAFSQTNSGAAFSTQRQSVGPIDISSYSALTGSNTIAIRLFAFNRTKTSGQDFGIDNIVLTGAVTAIPEPVAPVGLLAATVAILIRRRRH